ncbi:hypothetical protein DFH06DRAFT_1173323, partial [Mycena polygramma]
MLCSLCSIALGGSPCSQNVPCEGCGKSCAPADANAPRVFQPTELLIPTKTEREYGEKSQADTTSSWRKPYRYTYFGNAQQDSVQVPLSYPVSKLTALDPSTQLLRPRYAWMQPDPSSSQDDTDHVAMPYLSAGERTYNTPAIAYQTLDDLLAALNNLLCTAHLACGSDFCGTCAVVSEPGVQCAARVRQVSWTIIERTMLAFDIHKLKIHAGRDAAFASTQSAAIWMGAPTDERFENTRKARACARCEHLLTIGVSACKRDHVLGHRISVGLKHFGASGSVV